MEEKVTVKKIKKDAKETTSAKEKKTIPVDIYLSGAFNDKNNQYSYGVVVVYNNRKRKELSGNGSEDTIVNMEDVGGEMIGAMKAIQYAYDNGFKKITIHNHNDGIAMWGTGEWKSRDENTAAYKYFCQYMNNLMEIGFLKYTDSDLKHNPKYKRATLLAEIACGLKTEKIKEKK